MDDGKAARPQTITVKINGTNDGAIITPSKPGDDKGSVTEDDKLTANGKLDVVDPDKGEAVFKPQTDIAGTYGVLHRRQRQLEVRAQQQRSQGPGPGRRREADRDFRSRHRRRHQGTVTITVNGTNDAPTIGGVAAGAVKEDGTTTVSGQLTKNDVDTNDTHTWSIANNGNGQYGKFTVDQTGKWTYVLDNKSAQVSPGRRPEGLDDRHHGRRRQGRQGHRRPSPSRSPAPMTHRPSAAPPPARSRKTRSSTPLPAS